MPLPSRGQAKDVEGALHSVSRGARQARRNASNGGQGREGQESGERARVRTTSQEAEKEMSPRLCGRG